MRAANASARMRPATVAAASSRRACAAVARAFPFGWLWPLEPRVVTNTQQTEPEWSHVQRHAGIGIQ